MVLRSPRGGTMTSLESYLRDEYQKDKQQLKRTEDAIRKVAPIFVKHRKELATESTKIHTWPYRVVKGEAEEVKKFSDSTHCMILFALDAILQGTGELPQNFASEPILYPAKVRVAKLGVKDLSDVVLQARDEIIDLLLARDQEATSLVTSKTFGKNDPFTLTWLAELMLRCGTTSNTTFNDKVNKCKDRIQAAAAEVLDRKPNLLEWDKTEESADDTRHYEIEHCFQKLRCVHLAKATGRLGHQETEMIQKLMVKISSHTFLDELYRQLGYYTVPESRFDPAVLVFAMEGALQFDPNALSDSTIESVLRTLESSQKGNSYWRPVTPFLGDSRGMVLFPVSVEI